MSAILGWAPRISAFFLHESLHVHKILVGGGDFGFGGGEGEAPILFYGREDFSDSPSIESKLRMWAWLGQTFAQNPVPLQKMYSLIVPVHQKMYSLIVPVHQQKLASDSFPDFLRAFRSGKFGGNLAKCFWQRPKSFGKLRNIMGKIRSSIKLFCAN